MPQPALASSCCLLIGPWVLLACSLGPQATLKDASLEPIEGEDWRLVGVLAESAWLAVPSSDAAPTLHLQAGQLSGTLGCNRLRGAYRLDGPALAFTPNIASTLMACPQALMDQERWGLQRLGEVHAWRRDGDRLELLGATGQRLLELERVEPPTLSGSDWRLEAVNNGRGGLQSVLEAPRFSLRVEPSGAFAGQACNRYSGRAVLDGQGWRLDGPLQATRMHCAEPDGLMQQEHWLFEALQRSSHWSIEAGRLRLSDAEGAAQAVFSLR